MRRAARPWIMLLMLLPVAGTSCEPPLPTFVDVPIETRLLFLNLSQRFYAVIGIREHTAEGGAGEFSYSPLLAPGGAFRADFAELLLTGSPEEIDLRVLLYQRVNEDVPIGLDPTEEVSPAPIVAGELTAVPASSVQVLETYTVVNWDAPEGTGRVKIAQCSLIDEALRDDARLTDEGVWEIDGADPALAEFAPPPLAEIAPIVGRVLLADGTGVEGIGVLVRSQFRERLDCADPGREGDSGYSLPIDFAVTGADGSFELPRPPGSYQLELFSEEYAFRPGIVRIETPLDPITLLAEPIE